MAIQFKKDIIDNDIINRQFFIKNPVDNELEEVWMISPYHDDKELDQAEINKCMEKLGVSSGD